MHELREDVYQAILTMPAPRADAFDVADYLIANPRYGHFKMTGSRHARIDLVRAVKPHLRALHRAGAIERGPRFARGYSYERKK